MHPRATLRTAAASAAAAAAALLLAACSGGSAGHFTPLGGSSGGNGRQVLTAATVLRDVSAKTARVTSLTGTMSLQSGAGQTMGMQGSFRMRTVPDVAMELDMTISGAGQTVPGGMREIVTSSEVYVNLSTLAKLTGKAWIGVPASSLNKATGGAYGTMMSGFKQQDPLSVARMLATAKDVTSLGTETVNGISTTHLHGTFSYQQALASLPKQLRSMEQQYAAGLANQDITFDLWVDGQNLPRRIVETYDMAGLGQATITFDFTSFNQPVSITPPPASDVATVPGLG